MRLFPIPVPSVTDNFFFLFFLCSGCVIAFSFLSYFWFEPCEFRQTRERTSARHKASLSVRGLEQQPPCLWWVNLLTFKGQRGFSPLPTVFGNLIFTLRTSLCDPARPASECHCFKSKLCFAWVFPPYPASIETLSFPLPLNQLMVNMFSWNWQAIQARTMVPDKRLSF